MMPVGVTTQGYGDYTRYVRGVVQVETKNQTSLGEPRSSLATKLHSKSR